MATATDVRQIRAWVEKEVDEESVEGQYYAPAAHLLTFAPSNETCPYCKGAMRIVRAPMFGRIVKDEETRDRTGKVSAIVQLLPSTHEAFSCVECEHVFTINRADV